MGAGATSGCFSSFSLSMDQHRCVFFISLTNGSFLYKCRALRAFGVKLIFQQVSMVLNVSISIHMHIRMASSDVLDLVEAAFC